MPVSDSQDSPRRLRSPCLAVSRQMATEARRRKSLITVSTPSYILAKRPHPSYLKRRSSSKTRYMWFRLMATCLRLPRGSTLRKRSQSSITSKCLKWAQSLKTTCANSSDTGRTRLRKASHQRDRKESQKARGIKGSHQVKVDEGITEWLCGGNIRNVRIIRNMTTSTVISGHDGLSMVPLASCQIASRFTCSPWHRHCPLVMDRCIFLSL